MPVTIIH